MSTSFLWFLLYLISHSRYNFIIALHIPVPKERGCPVQLRYHRPSWPKRSGQYNGQAHHQWPGWTHSAEGIGFPTSGKGRPDLAQRPGEPVYIEGFYRVLWIRPCNSEHEQSRISIRQCTNGEVLQHSKERMHQPLWISNGGWAVPGRGRIRLCHLQPCTSAQL